MDTLYTQRLVLRPFEIEDLEDVYDYAKSPNVGPLAGWQAHPDKIQTAKTLIRFIEEGEVWAIVEKESGKVIGSIGLHKGRFVTGDSVQSLGYVLREDKWGKGYMTEAAKEVVRHGFEQMKLEMISVGHFDFNARSKRVIEKLGFIFEARLRNYYEHNGVLYGESFYSLTKEEYLKLQK